MLRRSGAMSETKSPQQLLIVALQDLHDAERAWTERLPDLGQKAGQALGRFIAEERVRAARQKVWLERLLDALDASPSGPPNIWLRAILDDAERDAATIEAGPLRDIALTGAFRKAKQSERVSYETAIGLADALDDSGAAESLIIIRDEEARADAALAGLLGDLLRATSEPRG